MYCFSAFSIIPFLTYAAFGAIVLALAFAWVYGVASDNGWNEGYHDGYAQRALDEKEEALYGWSSQRRFCKGSDRHAS